MDRLFVEEELFGRLGWFIRVRWVFLSGLVLTVAMTRVLRVGLPYMHIVAVACFICAYNVVFYLRHRSVASNGKLDSRKAQIEANIQIYMDYAALTLLIHYSGGVENPFISFYLLHLIIGSIILRRPQVLAQGVAAYTMFLSVVLLEFFGLIPHYTLKELFVAQRHQDPLYVLAVCLTFLVAVLSTIYLSSAVVERLRSREYELIQARSMLQKKSRDLEEANRELLEKHQQLVQSEKLASLGRLSAGMAHEINNPIQFIQGNMAILSEAMAGILPILDRHAQTDAGFKVARLDYGFFRQHIGTLLKDMGNGTVRIADIVRDLKKFARAEEGRYDESVDVNEAILASLRLVHNKIKHHEVVPQLDPGLPRIRGNANKIQQVVVANLINAAEAIGDRPDGRIGVQTAMDPGGASISICIADNGPGMTEEVKGRLFDPFFTTKQKTGGMGLGLSVSYGIIKDHQGWVDVDTNLGEGTCLRYHFPVVRSEG